MYVDFHDTSDHVFKMSHRRPSKISGIVPGTFVPGFHDESAVKRMIYSRLGNTDMIVSNIGVGGVAFGGYTEEVKKCA